MTTTSSLCKRLFTLKSCLGFTFVYIFIFYLLVPLFELESRPMKQLLPPLSSGPVTFEDDVLLYLRIHKTGSTTMEELVRKLAAKNTGKKLETYRGCVRCFVDEGSKKDFGRFILNLDKPKMISGHINFVPAADFGQMSPVWVSIVRDPIARFVSAYDFARTADSKVYNSRSHYDHMLNEGSMRVYNLTYEQWLRLDLNWCLEHRHPDCALTDNQWPGPGKSFTQVHYFCGHEYDCGRLNNRAALERAKNNIERYFKVVGILEDFELSLKVMETALPKFFNGAAKMYSNSSKKSHNKGKSHVILTQENERLLRDKWAVDYELLDFVRKRLYDQKSQYSLQ